MNKHRDAVTGVGDASRRDLRRLRQDPNVLWARMATVDRLDLLEAKIEPAPPREYRSRDTAVLLTRTGLVFRPMQDRWGLPGAELSSRRIEAVLLGQVWQGGQHSDADR